MHLREVGDRDVRRRRGRHASGRRWEALAQDTERSERVHHAFLDRLGGHERVDRSQQRQPSQRRRDRVRQHPGDRTDAAVEPELTHAHRRKDVARDLPGGGKDAHGDGQVEPGPVFAHRRWREVDRHPRVREVEAARAESGAHAVPCFEDRGVAEADDREGRKPCRHVHLDLDVDGVHADERGRRDGRLRHDGEANAAR